MQLLDTVWPAVAFLPVFAFVTGMAVAALIASSGGGLVSAVSGFVVGTACSIGALAVLCAAFNVIDPVLFDRHYMSNRAIATSLFSMLGALAGVLYVRGFHLSALWRRR